MPSLLPHDSISRSYCRNPSHRRSSPVSLSDCLIEKPAAAAIPIWFVTPKTLQAVTAVMSSSSCDWIVHTGFKPRAGRSLLLPGAGGRIQAVLFGLGEDGAAERTPFLPGLLAAQLPPGDYYFGNSPDDAELAALSFALHAYRFARYRKPQAGEAPRLVIPAGVAADEVRRLADSIAFGRDLINLPANELGPEEIAKAALDLARHQGAASEVIAGEALLERGFPLIHAVGKASTRPPCLVDLRWGDESAPKVTLVGKGVAFDTGGLDLKPSSNMLLMKKDMGGAAAVLTLARLVMERGLKVRLRVLLACVENAVSGASFRPGDIYPSRRGLSVEIGNTDAEGRLILADALCYGDEDAPDLMIDMATLTGAARVALGPDLPPFYTNDNALAAEMEEAATSRHDPLWRMPLWAPYDAMLESKIADLNNVSSSGLAGSITAALFLNRFVEHAKAHLHLDIFGWTPQTKPGRPEGGEVQGVRALYHLLCRRYG